MSSLAHVVPRAVAAAAAHPRPGRRRLLRLLRQPGERACAPSASRRSTSSASWPRRPASAGTTSGPGCRAAASTRWPGPGSTVISRDVVVYALLEDMLAGRAGGLRRLPRLRRGRPPRRPRAGRQPRGAAQHRPADRPAAPGEPRWRRAGTTSSCLSDHGQTQGEAFSRAVRGVDRGAGRPAVRRRRRPRAGGGTCRRPEGQPPDGGGLAGDRRAGRERAGRSRGGCASGPSARRTSRHDHRRRPASPARCRGSRPAWSAWSRGHMAMVSLRRPARPGVAGGDRAALARPAARAGRPRRRRLPARALRGVRPGRARPRRRCTGWPRGVVIGDDPLAALRRARRRAGRAGRRRSRTAPTSSSTAATTPTPTRPRRSSRTSARTAGSAARSSTGSSPSAGVGGRPGEIVGAEHLHRVLRGWLTDLGHPEPTGEGAAVGEDSPTALHRRRVPTPRGLVGARATGLCANSPERWTGDDRDVTGGYECVNSRIRHGPGGSRRRQ